MQLVFYLPIFSTPCMGYLLYLMFRCDGKFGNFVGNEHSHGVKFSRGHHAYHHQVIHLSFARVLYICINCWCKRRIENRRCYYGSCQNYSWRSSRREAEAHVHVHPSQVHGSRCFTIDTLLLAAYTLLQHFSFGTTIFLARRKFQRPVNPETRVFRSSVY